jgi:hypothetical protein
VVPTAKPEAPKAEGDAAHAVLRGMLRCACAGGEAIQAALARHGDSLRDPTAEVRAPTPRSGDVVCLTPPLFVTFVSSTLAAVSHAPGVRDAADHARARGTYAIGGHGTYVCADAPAAQLKEALRTVTGSDALWDALAGGYSGFITPALAQRLAETEQSLQAYARAEGYMLDPVRLATRATALLDAELVIASLKRGSTVTVTDKAWREAISRAHRQAVGGAPIRDRPPAWDWRGLANQLGYTGEPRTKATSHWPYPPHAHAPGHIPSIAVHKILEELERLDGPASDTDSELWLALDHLYAQEIYLDREITADIAAAAARGKALVLSPAHKAHVDTADDKAFEGVIKERERMGVIAPVSKEEAMKAGNVVSALKCAAKAPLKVSAAEAQAIADKDLAAIASHAWERASGMYNATQASIAAGSAPIDAAEAAHAAEMQPGKLRMCHSGHALTEHMNYGSFTLPTSAHLLEDATPGTFMYASDMPSWYFAVMVGIAALFAHFVTWKGRFWVQRRMSMGLGPSAIVASIASAFIVYFAMRYGVKAIKAYIDDLIGSARSRAEAERDQALVHHAAAIVLPGGVAPQKTRTPAAVQVALGLEYNFPAGTLGVSHDKMFAYAIHLFFAFKCLSSTSHHMRMAVSTPSLVALTGKLGFLSQTTPVGRIHLRSLYAHSAQKQLPAAFFRTQLVEELAWWTERMRAGTLPVTHFFSMEAPPTLVHVCGGGVDSTGGPERLAPEGPRGGSGVPVVRSDAGDEGAAAIHEGDAIYRQWTREEQGYSSDLREILIVRDAARAMGPRWRGKRVVFVLDHSGNCDNLNSGSSKSSARAREVIDWMYAHAEEHGYAFVALWAPRESNAAADALSKCRDAGAARAECRALGLNLVQ